MSITAGQQIVASDFKTSSAGASDSGKVIKLDANGLIDDSAYGVEVFTAEEDLTAGQTVGISNYIPSGSVGRANRRAPQITTSFTGADDLAKPGASCPIGGDKFVFLNYQTSDDTLYATVGSINRATKTTTLGTSVAVTTDIKDGVSYYTVCKLNTDKFIVFYLEDASTTIVKYRVYTVSGTTATPGTAATYYTAATAVGYIDCDQLSTDKGVVYVACGSTPTDSRLVAFTTSGTVATPGTAKTVGTTLDDNTIHRIKTIGTDKFILATQGKRAQVGTLSGTTITLGAEATITATTINAPFDIVSPATDVAVMTYRDGSNIGEIVACTVSGTTATFGTPLTMNQYDSNLWAESATSLLVVNNTNDGVRKYTLSGNTLTSIGTVIKNTNNNPMRILPIDSGYFTIISHNSSNFYYFIQGMTNMFQGIVENTVSRAGTARVRFCGVNANQSGLIPGRIYQADGSGGLVAVDTSQTVNTPDDKFVSAKSATEVLINW